MKGGALLLAILLSVTTGGPAAADASGLLAIPRTMEEPATVPAPPLRQTPEPLAAGRNYKQLMRDVVMPLAAYARQRNPNFIVLLRGGSELLFTAEAEAPTADQPMRSPARHRLDPAMLKNLDAVILDGQHCGPANGTADAASRRSLTGAGMRILLVERCANPTSRATAIDKAAKERVLLYAPESPGRIFQPGRPPDENAAHITSLAVARNFLVETRPAGIRTAGELVAALRETNFDLVVVDPYIGATPLSAAEVASLRFKRLGSRRLAIASLSLGFAQPGRHYWRMEWQEETPAWMGGGQSGGQGHLVEYWNSEWKEILGLFLKGLIDLGYDGVMFEDASVFTYFEKTLPTTNTK